MEMIEEMVLCLVGEPGCLLIVGGGMRDWVKRKKFRIFSEEFFDIRKRDVLTITQYVP